MRRAVLAAMVLMALVALWERWGQVVRQGPLEPPDLEDLLDPQRPDPLGLPEHLASRASRGHQEATAGWAIRGPLDPQELREWQEWRDHLEAPVNRANRGPLVPQEIQAQPDPQDQSDQPGQSDPQERKARRPPDSSAPPDSHRMN